MSTISTLHPLEQNFDWNNYLDKRYLRCEDFRKLCDAVNLRFCSEMELEQYERERLLFPSARLVDPEGYAIALWQSRLTTAGKFEFDDEFSGYHQLRLDALSPDNFPGRVLGDDLRHPIDKAWGEIEQLVAPGKQPFKPWGDYKVKVPVGSTTYPLSRVHHFYHYWQIHQVFQVRRFHRNMYQDGYPIQERLEDEALWRLLDAASYFQHVYTLKREQILADSEPNPDGWIEFTPSQRDELAESSRQHATKTLEKFGFDEGSVYEALRKLMQLHNDYEVIERLRLAEALKRDIWHVVGVIYFAFQTDTEEIKVRAGHAGGFIRPYLELLFPYRLNEYQEKATDILRAWLKYNNERAGDYAVSANDVEEFVNYALSPASTGLASAIFSIVEMNRVNSEIHPWVTVEKFILLKTLAGVPESLIKSLKPNNYPNSLSKIIHQFLIHTSGTDIHEEYNNVNRRSAKNPLEFETKSSELINLIKGAENEAQYLGYSLALTTLIRNYTSHNTIGDPALIQGKYTASIGAVISSLLLIWKLGRTASTPNEGIQTP